MNNKELKILKKELLEAPWTEDVHEGLKKLKPVDSKKIIESLDKTEIYSLVNVRHCQEDYIADYIEYLWDIRYHT